MVHHHVPPRVYLRLATQVKFLRPSEGAGGQDFFNIFVLHQVGTALAVAREQPMTGGWMPPTHRCVFPRPECLPSVSSVLLPPPACGSVGVQHQPLHQSPPLDDAVAWRLFTYFGRRRTEHPNRDSSWSPSCSTALRAGGVLACPGVVRTVTKWVF